MLALKRLSEKKVITYFVIIFTMASGIIFLFYQNHQLAVKKSSPIINIIPAIPVTDQIATSTEIDNSKNKEETSAIDTAIFKNPKYQAMKDNSVLLINNKETVGKRNPFEQWK
ncbi:MAG: hypothetical protein V1649_00820 [Patescibacteria group bacterium]